MNNCVFFVDVSLFVVVFFFSKAFLELFRSLLATVCHKSCLSHKGVAKKVNESRK